MRPSLFDVIPHVPAEVHALQLLNRQYGDNELILDHESAICSPLVSSCAHVIADTLFILSGKALTEFPSPRIDREFAALIRMGNVDREYLARAKNFILGLRASVELIEFNTTKSDPIEKLKTTLQEQVLVASKAPILIPVMAIKRMDIEI